MGTTTAKVDEDAAAGDDGPMAPAKAKAPSEPANPQTAKNAQTRQKGFLFMAGL
jgi:hypothetical protein